jgi:hypothetical protein
MNFCNTRATGCWTIELSLLVSYAGMAETVGPCSVYGKWRSYTRTRWSITARIDIGQDSDSYRTTCHPSRVSVRSVFKKSFHLNCDRKSTCTQTTIKGEWIKIYGGVTHRFVNIYVENEITEYNIWVTGLRIPMRQLDIGYFQFS